ncbi:Hypothetical predicted protein [Marmota monax]|uniref:Uncharacterized protein n=1 Tax=Marmota monax TaxID=9995 RepID=A0A5E4B1K6_MARMO|nr:Hypothetical predicted protein [Marmota monax]
MPPLDSVLTLRPDERIRPLPTRDAQNEARRSRAGAVTRVSLRTAQRPPAQNVGAIRFARTDPFPKRSLDAKGTRERPDSPVTGLDADGVQPT